MKVIREKNLNNKIKNMLQSNSSTNNNSHKSNNNSSMFSHPTSNRKTMKVILPVITKLR